MAPYKIVMGMMMMSVMLMVAEGKKVGKDGGAIPSSEATEIGKIICTPEEFHDDKWFKCIECCQSINAYTLVTFTLFFSPLSREPLCD